MSKIELYNADCLDIMKAMPDKSVDLILTDPPYGIGEANGKNLSRGKKAKAGNYGKLDWDNSIPSKEIFNEIFRISKNQIIFGGNYFVEYLKNTPCWIVWDKQNGESDFADCELAWTSFKSAVRLIQIRWCGMLQYDMKNKEIRQHPTQKPLKLMKWCLENYSTAGQTVLDCFMGSGTTGVACVEMDRNFIGIELHKPYFDIATQRIKDVQAQTKLF